MMKGVLKLIPLSAPNADLALFLFDSWFDRYKGAINLGTVNNLYFNQSINHIILHLSKGFVSFIYSAKCKKY